ncbi:hypothetical protein QWC_30961 [Achromobacter marplatensis]|nr:hypothetical protein QWC_30961 [Achromobacter marplatensis]
MAIHAGKSQIQDDRIEFFDCQPSFGDKSVVSPFNDKARMSGQASGKPTGKFGFVFYQEDAHGRSPGGRGWAEWESMFGFSFISLYIKTND